MSNRLFQGLVYQMRDTVDRMIGVIDESATIIACSDLTKIGEPNDFLASIWAKITSCSSGTALPTSPLAPR